MIPDPPESWFEPPSAGPSLPAYFLGSVPMPAFLPWQRRIAFDVSGADHSGAMVLCEHSPGITIGRDGSRVHVRLSNVEIHSLGWHVQWVARGGGVMLHVPGQIAISIILKFDGLGVTPAAFRDTLQDAAQSVLANYVAEIRTDSRRAGLFVRDRLLVHTGLAIRGGVSSFGLTVNVNPDLELFRKVWVDGDCQPMTSLERESSLRVRVPTLRQQLAETIAARFGYDRLSVFHHHPALRLHDPHPAAR